MAGTISRVSWRRSALAVGAALLLAAPIAAQSPSQRLLADAGDGRLDDIPFFSAALVASGVDDERELSRWLDSYTQRQTALLSSLADRPAGERLQAIQRALHSSILTGRYDTAASDVRVALSHGDFNCLSSVAIYLDWCQAADLPMSIWLGQGHVFLRAAVDGEAVVIEPGIPQWKKQNTTRQHSSRQITPVELLGKFYYNRGVQALKDGKFAAGLDLLRASLVFDPQDSDARANLVAGLNNWAADHCRANRYGDAALLIEQGLLLDPAFAPLIANERLVRAKLGL